jgi:hypothetical protein
MQSPCRMTDAEVSQVLLVSERHTSGLWPTQGSFKRARLHPYERCLKLRLYRVAVCFGDLDAFKGNRLAKEVSK